MVVSLCCDNFKEVKYDCEKSLKEEKRQKRRTKREMESAKDMLSFVLCTFGMLAALDEWTSLKEPRLLTGNAWPLSVT